MLKTEPLNYKKGRANSEIECAWCGIKFISLYGQAKYCVDHKLKEFRKEWERKK